MTRNDTREDHLEYITPLEKAKACWRNGFHISTSLYGELLNEGYDVQALENLYLKQ